MLVCIDEENKTLEMAEGDFGLSLLIEITTKGEEIISSEDSFALKIYKEPNGELLVTKTYNNIQGLTIDLSLTKQESLKMPVGTYYYDLDWFQGQTFLGNIIRQALWYVRDKAGGIDAS